MKNFQKIPEQELAACTLKRPELYDGKILKGLLVLTHDNTNYASERLRFLKKYFFIVERQGWYGVPTSPLADIKLVDDESEVEKTRRMFPGVILLPIGGADFVDTDIFTPLDLPKDYTGIQIANWAKFKRHELFIEATNLLPAHKFIKFGHFIKSGFFVDRYKNKIVRRSKAGNVDFPFLKAKTNSELSLDPKAMNELINKARMGIVTSSKEGINRFKTECMAANIPFLIAEDANHPLKKHINEQTGMFFNPTPEGLASAVLKMLKNYDQFSPRAYILKHTGLQNSIQKLKYAVKKLCVLENQPYRFDDIYYNGRNENLYWNKHAVTHISSYSSLEIDGADKDRHDGTLFARSLVLEKFFSIIGRKKY